VESGGFHFTVEDIRTAMTSSRRTVEQARLSYNLTDRCRNEGFGKGQPRQAVKCGAGCRQPSHVVRQGSVW
jgi:hypothetical protein